MYEDMGKCVSDRGAYLARIGCVDLPVECTRAFLDHLVMAHLRSIPFENLDIMLFRRCPSLRIDDLEEKIVYGQRGGYCFELNNLFRALLSSLGFEAWSVMVRVFWHRSFVPPLSHGATIVRIGSCNYYCDVGFGGPLPGLAIPIRDGWSSGAFSVSMKGGYVEVCLGGVPHIGFHLECGKTVKLFEPCDFVPLNYAAAYSEDSFVNKKIMVRKLTEFGSVSIKSDVFRRRVMKRKEDRPIENEEELKEILAREFGIRLS